MVLSFGDINNDGVVDIQDVIHRKYIPLTEQEYHIAHKTAYLGDQVSQENIDNCTNHIRHKILLGNNSVSTLDINIVFAGAFPEERKRDYIDYTFYLKEFIVRRKYEDDYREDILYGHPQIQVRELCKIKFAKYNVLGYDNDESDTKTYIGQNINEGGGSREEFYTESVKNVDKLTIYIVVGTSQGLSGSGGGNVSMKFKKGNRVIGIGFIFSLGVLNTDYDNPIGKMHSTLDPFNIYTKSGSLYLSTHEMLHSFGILPSNYTFNNHLYIPDIRDDRGIYISGYAPIREYRKIYGENTSGIPYTDNTENIDVYHPSTASHPDPGYSQYDDKMRYINDVPHPGTLHASISYALWQMKYDKYISNELRYISPWELGVIEDQGFVIDYSEAEYSPEALNTTNGLLQENNVLQTAIYNPDNTRLVIATTIGREYGGCAYKVEVEATLVKNSRIVISALNDTSVILYRIEFVYSGNTISATGTHHIDTSNTFELILDRDINAFSTMYVYLKPYTTGINYGFTEFKEYYSNAYPWSARLL